MTALQEERDNPLRELETVAGRPRDQATAGEQRNTELEQARRVANDARRALEETRRAADETRAIQPPASFYGSVRADNLEDLRGIGPVQARRLRDFGVTTFRQVSWGSDADFDRFQACLSEFPDRRQRRYERPWAEGTLVDGTRP